MVQFVAGNDVCDGPDTHFALIGHTPAQPRRFVQAAEQGQSRLAHRSKFIDQGRQAVLAEGSEFYVVVLLEALHRSLVVASNAQSAVSEYPLGIDQVTERFFYAPLSGSVAQISVFLVA